MILVISYEGVASEGVSHGSAGFISLDKEALLLFLCCLEHTFESCKSDWDRAAKPPVAGCLQSFLGLTIMNSTQN